MANDSVAKRNAEQSKMVDRAAMERALMGGTAAMRAADVAYLPKEPMESVAAYASRKARTFLFNAFGKTVDDMTGKVFRKSIVLKDNVPAQLVTWAENIDLTGRHINVFARDVFHDAMQPGIGYIFADMPPKVERGDGRPATVADEAKAGIRPYLTYIPLERLLGWKSETVAGAERLTQIRIKECVKEADGEFLEKEVEQIRVVEPGRWRTFRKSKEVGKTEDWVQFAEGVSSITDKITLVPFYANRTEFMQAEPPLEKLAELNIAHWQSQSDQKNILHVARVPILFGAGFDSEEPIAIGASEMVRNNKPEATLQYVEHSGAAIGAGDTDLKNLEFQMQTMGLQLLVPQPGGKTATGEVRDDAKENSPLAMIATALQDALETALGFMAEYGGLGNQSVGEVEVNKDFGIGDNIADVPQITAQYSAGLLDAQTALEELKRRGFLSDSVDPEVVMDRAAQAVKLEAETAMDLAEKTKPPIVAE